MALICILIGIIFEWFNDSLENLRNFDWFDNYNCWLFDTLPGIANQDRSSILILLAPLLFIVAMLQIWSDDKVLGLLDLIIGTLVFAYCLGPKDINQQINRYLKAKEDGDEEAALNEASGIMQAAAPSDPDQQSIEVMRSVLYESNDRIFAVIFWFVLLGPFGALFYRLTSYTMRSTNRTSLADAARHLQAILAWAPAHLVAMGYALTGNYEGAKQEYSNKNKLDELNENNYHTLISAGQGALKNCTPGDESACIRSARSLVVRTLIVWLAGIATLTLIGRMA